MSESTGYSIDEILADVKKITESTEIDPLDELFGGTDAEEKGFSADAQIIENSEEETVFDDIEKENKEHYVYQIEIITGKSTIEGNKHLNFTLEPYTVFPTYKNSTLIKVYHYYELNGQIVITFYSI